MNVSRRTIRIWLIAGIAASLLTIGLTRLTDAFHLRSVTYNGQQMDNYVERFGMRDSASVFEQPIDSLVNALLSEESVFRVDVDLSIPHGIDIRTNNFKPVCYAININSGELYGLTRDGRAVGLRTAERDWENPIICGVEVSAVFHRCPDHRVARVIDELNELEERNRDLYRMVDEIDLFANDHARVTIGGFPYRLMIRADRLASDIIRIADFVSKYQHEIDSVKVIDLRFENMIVTSRGRR